MIDDGVGEVWGKERVGSADPSKQHSFDVSANVVEDVKVPVQKTSPVAEFPWCDGGEWGLVSLETHDEAETCKEPAEGGKKDDGAEAQLVDHKLEGDGRAAEWILAEDEALEEMEGSNGVGGHGLLVCGQPEVVEDLGGEVVKLRGLGLQHPDYLLEQIVDQSVSPTRPRDNSVRLNNKRVSEKEGGTPVSTHDLNQSRQGLRSRSRKGK